MRYQRNVVYASCATKRPSQGDGEMKREIRRPQRVLGVAWIRSSASLCTKVGRLKVVFQSVVGG